MSHTNSTTNYGLPQFLSSDKPAWMADINVAMSDIDTQMKLNADAAATANTDIGTLSLNFASGYSNLSTYDVGDVVVYNKRMYICDVAVTVPEAFDNAINAPVNSSCNFATSLVFPHTPAFPTQPVQPAVCSH